jgi:drug/metabolite transporter (DMT)-like permease
MIYILLSVICSVLVSVLLKLAARCKVDVGQAIAWNYVVASGLTALVYRPDLAALHTADTPWIGLIGLGILLPTIFLALGASVRHAGIVRTDAAQRLSLLISLLAAFVLFGDVLTRDKGLGIALGLLALACMVWQPRGHAISPGVASRRYQAWGYPLLVLLGFGAIDILLKRVAQASGSFTATLLAMFVLALLVSIALQLWRRLRGQTRFSARSACAGLLLGLLNFGNILFYLRGHQALPQHPALVFASVNLGVVALGALVGLLGFRERLSRINALGLLLAVVAILLITHA